jgi:hypothetical protein
MFASSRHFNGRTRTISAPQRLQRLRHMPSIRRADDTER